MGDRPSDFFYCSTSGWQDTWDIIQQNTGERERILILVHMKITRLKLNWHLSYFPWLVPVYFRLPFFLFMFHCQFHYPIPICNFHLFIFLDVIRIKIQTVPIEISQLIDHHSQIHTHTHHHHHWYWSIIYLYRKQFLP